MSRRIAVVTSSRADWCHLHWPLSAMRAHPELEPIVIATGAMLAPEYGRGRDVASQAGFEPDEIVDCLLASDTEAAMARTIGLATTGFADVLERRRPDAVVVIADRYEMLAPASAALALRIPIVHVEGGEASEGVIDHAVRNALSMLASHHLVTTRLAARRLVTMGEAPWRIHRTGAASLDHLRLSRLEDREVVCRDLGLDPARPYVVAAYHPVTLDEAPAAGVDAMLAALDGVEAGVLVCHPNADAGGRSIARRLETWCRERDDRRFTVNLDPIRYWSVLRGAAAMCGNSSSGVMESASAGVPAVDIGDRQAGREVPDSVRRVPAEPAAIREGLAWAMTGAAAERARVCENPYGDGHASDRVATVLAGIDLSPTVLRKPAVPVDEHEDRRARSCEAMVQADVAG